MTLDDRIKELIAVGASITANCHTCLQYHASEAEKMGGDGQEIMDAIEARKIVRRGAASIMDKFAATFIQPATPAMSSSSEGCGCPA
jgi:AhpD family alkylhydroperoxidase